MNHYSIAKRNREIVKLIKQGYQYRKIANMFGVSYQTVCNVKLNYLGDLCIYKQCGSQKHGGPLGYEPDKKGLYLLGVNLLREAIRDFYSNNFSTEDLDALGRFFGLNNLSSVAKHNRKLDSFLHTLSQ